MDGLNISLWDKVRMTLGLGMRCPECRAKPMKRHKSNCSIGKWDGGTWA